MAQLLQDNVREEEMTFVPKGHKGGGNWKFDELILKTYVFHNMVKKDHRVVRLRRIREKIVGIPEQC